MNSSLEKSSRSVIIAPLSKAVHSIKFVLFVPIMKENTGPVEVNANGDVSKKLVEANDTAVEIGKRYLVKRTDNTWREYRSISLCSLLMFCVIVLKSFNSYDMGPSSTFPACLSKIHVRLTVFVSP